MTKEIKPSLVGPRLQTVSSLLDEVGLPVDWWAGLLRSLETVILADAGALSGAILVYGWPAVSVAHHMLQSNT
jgi:hypothetical protein